MIRAKVHGIGIRALRGVAWLFFSILLLPQLAQANAAPVAQDDEVSTGASAPILIEVLANDSDPDNDPIRLISGSPVSNGPTNGSATRLNDTIIRYTPNAGFRGLEQFRYRMTDGVADASAWVSVHVDNRPPVAVGDFSDIDAATTVDIDVLANDSDPDGDPVQRIESAATPQPTHGSVTWLSNAIARYTPAPGFTGNDSFRYYVTDGLGGEASALVFVNVSYANHPPVAVDDIGIVVDNGLPKQFNPLVNDSDPNGDPIRLDPNQPIIALPAHGTVAVIDDHTLEYTPDPAVSGTDTFEYRITDGAFTAVASVILNLGGNQPPVAVDDRRGTALETPLSVNVIANDWDPDGDAIRLTGGNPVVTPPANGTATRLSDTTIRYTPNPGFQGTDQFRYQVIDGLPGGTATAWVQIGVGNRAPIAMDDTATAPAGGSMVIEVVANDRDEDGDTLMLPLETNLPQPTHGARLRVNNTSFRYFPNAGFVGTDSFQYEVEDSWGARDVATVSITVSANQPPVAVGDQMFTETDRPVTRNVVANDSDPDGDPIALTGIVGMPTHGQATVVDSTSIRFEPDPGFTGNDSFTYEIADDNGATATAAVDVGIAAVPTPTVTGLTDSTPILKGERKIVIFQGTDFHGAEVGIATVAYEDGDPPRTFPDVELVGVSQSGTRLSVRVDARASGVEGFYNISIETPGGMTAGQVRVVGPEPVIDVWTPSEPVLGRVHVLQILGENLGGADVVPMHPGVRILDVDNGDSKSLSGLMFVSSSVSINEIDLRIDGLGGSTILPMEIQPEIPRASKHTEELPVRNAAPGEVVPSILLQEPISAFSPAELQSQLGFQPDDTPRSAITAEERASLRAGTFCFTARAVQGHSYEAIRFSLLDEIGDPLTIEAINALLPGQSLDFNSLTIALTGFIRFEFSYQFCSNGVSDLRICTTGGITGMVPAIGGWHFGFNYCFGGGGGFRTVLAGSGAINDHGYTSTNACVRASDAEPPGFPAGERRGTLSVDCCAHATIGLQSRGVVFDGTFVAQGPILNVEPICTPPPSGQFMIFLDVDDDNDFNVNTAVPLTELDDLPKYLPGTTTSGDSVPDLSQAPQRMKLVAAYVSMESGGARVVPPPAGITEVSFTLTETSAFEGVAGNWPTTNGSIAPDFHLGPGSGTSQITIPFGNDQTARVDFTANDYGGFTTLEATPDNGTSVETIRIPMDDGRNLLPDAGWKAFGRGLITADPRMVASDDLDLDPTAPAPNPARGRIGDGLSLFEEYRGFMVRGMHRRTDPSKKDLFLSSNILMSDIGYADNLPLTVHRVRGVDEGLNAEYDANHEINFNQANHGSGGNVPGYSLQKAVRAKNSTSTRSCVYGRAPQGDTTPNEADPVEVFVSQHNTMCMPSATPTQLGNELRRTLGHEVGHAIHICHRVVMENCSDMNEVGPNFSIMNSAVILSANGPNDFGSQYNNFDKAQIRLHINP